MKKISFLLLLATIFWFGCKQTPATTEETQAETESFGAGVANADAALGFSQIYTQLDSIDSLSVTMRAKVSDVCQAKGCWMNLVDPADSTSSEIFVQFHDYGFFMPKDIAGKEVIVEGYAYTEETSVEALKHYAEDAGKSAEEIAAITEPVTEKKFMATGVVLIK